MTQKWKKITQKIEKITQKIGKNHIFKFS